MIVTVRMKSRSVAATSKRQLERDKSVRNVLLLKTRFNDDTVKELRLAV